jgi:Type IX secretion system membrane protein PorP/SprF
MKSIAYTQQSDKTGQAFTAIYRNVVMFLVMALSNHLIIAQDLRFSQWYNSPLTTNPANTGFIPASDYRIGANYRNQWSSVLTQPYRTFSAFGDG